MLPTGGGGGVAGDRAGESLRTSSANQKHRHCDGKETHGNNFKRVEHNWEECREMFEDTG